MNPLIYALFGAISASAGTIFAKFGLKGVDSNLLTVVRGIIMAIAVSLFGIFVSKISFSEIQNLTTKNWIFVILSALGGALSWLFFYHALVNGNVVSVSVIDKLSLVFTAILAFFLLSEKISWTSGIGIFLIVVGSVLVSIPLEKIISLFK